MVQGDRLGAAVSKAENGKVMLLHYLCVALVTSRNMIINA